MPEPVESALHDAIQHANPDALRKILQQLCIRNDEAAALTRSTLMDNIDGGRERERYETCKHCKAEYDVTKNEKGDCVYHPGR